MIYRLIAQLNWRVLGCWALCIFLTSIAEAHPGHGSAEGSENGHALIHYLTTPYHSVGILGTAAVIVGCAYYAAKYFRAARD